MVADGPCRCLTEHMQGKPSLGLTSVSSMAGQECACADRSLFDGFPSNGNWSCLNHAGLAPPVIFTGGPGYFCREGMLFVLWERGSLNCN